MRSVVNQIGKGVPKILGESWRSREELVNFTSSLFERAFVADGFQEKEIRLKAATKYQSDIPSLALWRLSGRTLPLRWASLASEIKSFLETKPLVTDRNTGQKRPILPGDISVLAPTNDWCMAIADAIRSVGVEASFSSGSLMAQPEVILALASYRFAVDEKDRLAAGEIAILMGANHDEWLEQALNGSSPSTWSKTLANLSEIRGRCIEYTPVELLDEVISVAGIESFVERLEKGADRLSNFTGAGTLYGNWVSFSFGGHLGTG